MKITKIPAYRPLDDFKSEKEFIGFCKKMGWKYLGDIHKAFIPEIGQCVKDSVAVLHGDYGLLLLSDDEYKLLSPLFKVGVIEGGKK